MTTTPSVHPVDEILPTPRLATLGLQHVLVMYAGAIAVPLIVGRALQLTPEQVALLISADLFVCGIVTLIQSLGIDNGFGIKLPVMMGVTFAAVGPMVAMANANPASDGARAIFGAIIGAGIISMLIAPLMGRLLRFFPPVVTGTIIAIIGISLMRVGVGWALGGPAFLAQRTDVPRLVEMVDAARRRGCARRAPPSRHQARPDPDARQPDLRRARQPGDRRLRAGRRSCCWSSTGAASSPTSRCCSASSPAASSRWPWARWASTRSARRAGSTSCCRSPSACRPSTSW